MKKYLLIIIVLIIAGLAGWLWLPKKANQPQSLITNQEIQRLGSTNKALLSLTYSRKPTNHPFLNVGFDLNQDKAISDEEWLIKNMPMAATRRNNFYFTLPTSTTETLSVRIIASEKTVADINRPNETLESSWNQLAMTQVVMVDLFELAKVTNPEESMKGIIQLAQAQDSSITESGTDISQRPAECAPTGATNSIYDLAFRNGQVDKLPDNPMDLVDQLKGEMNWTPEDGVLPDNFVAGKTRLAAKLGLPIRTEMVGDRQGAGALEKIKNTLDNGGAAEIRFRFTDVGSTKVNGGHLVTVVSIHSQDGRDFIDVHDPASPTGTDTYEVRGNILVGYPFHDGGTYLGQGFIQTWENTPTGTSLDPMTEEEIRGIEKEFGDKPTRTIKVIIVNGRKIPLEQVHIGQGPECDELAHYHANKASVTALDGTKLTDPGGCGYGKVKDIPVEDAQIE